MLIVRFISWSIRRIGLATVATVLLLLLALSSLLSGLANVVRGFDLTLTTTLAVGGLLLAWLLAKTPLPAWLAGLVAFSLGGEAILIWVGRLERLLLAWPGLLAEMAWGIWRWPLAGPPEWRGLADNLGQLYREVSVLLLRLGQWLSGLLRSESSFEPVATTIIWSLAVWSVAVWAGWVTRRQSRPLLALTPAAVLLTTVLAHTRREPNALLPFLLALLLLLALVRHHAREKRWQAAGVSYSPELRLDQAFAVIPLTLALVAAAWLVANISFRSLNNFVRTIFWPAPVAQDQSVADSLGLQANAVGSEETTLERVRQGGLPQLHLLGSGPELSQQVVLTIQTNDPPPAQPDQAPRYYWRGLTYERYTGRGWDGGNTQRIDYAAGESTGLPPPAQARLLRQTVQGTALFSGLLYVSGELASADQAYRVAWRGPNDIFGATVAETPYQADSYLPLVGEAELREAGSDYSETIQQRYLALPARLPDRVYRLARDLTATAATPYDRATAIERYLRTFPYTLDLPPPPANRDIADYFLFELQRGYCDYYATAMVTLARAAGLPARLAVGYIGGRYEAETGRYIVTAAEAHSWPEVYFPDIGWVTFEPTGGRPAIERAPTVPTVALAPLLPPPAPENEAFGGELYRWLGLLIGGLALLGLGLLAWSWLDRRRLSRLSPAGTLTALQQRLYGHGRRLNTPTHPGDTPYEFAGLLAEQITNLSMRSKWREQLAPTGPEVGRLTDLYVQALFSPHHVTLTDQAAAIALWQRLRRRLWLAWLLAKSLQGLGNPWGQMKRRIIRR